jgi:hypothetical protein
LHYTVRRLFTASTLNIDRIENYVNGLEAESRKVVECPESAIRLPPMHDPAPRVSGRPLGPDPKPCGRGMMEDVSCL